MASRLTLNDLKRAEVDERQLFVDVHSGEGLRPKYCLWRYSLSDLGEKLGNRATSSGQPELGTASRLEPNVPLGIRPDEDKRRANVRASTYILCDIWARWNGCQARRACVEGAVREHDKGHPQSFAFEVIPKSSREKPRFSNVVRST